MRKFTKFLVLMLALVMVFGTIYSSAYEPYDTYTYSIDGLPMKSPAAYTAEAVYDTVDMQIDKLDPTKPDMLLPSDIVTDDKGNVYMADKGNNRIVVLDKYFKAQRLLTTYVDNTGTTRSFNAPQGIYVTPSKDGDITTSNIYVCDTGNHQVVVFDRNFEYVRTIKRPSTPLLTDESFVPQAIAVDNYGRIFITSDRCYEGVIVLSAEGEFTGFIGAQTVTPSFIDLIWRRFQTKEQRKQNEKNTADPYNNVTVDKDGFVYVTTEYKEDGLAAQFAAITSKAAGNSPVKKLNSAGAEIMKRNGFFDPSGEVAVIAPGDVSTIVDVAIGPEGSWSILDTKRSRIFTYDDNGNLLFAFGDMGDQLGNGESLVGMAYQVIDGTYYILALDNSSPTKRVTVYAPTPYHETIMSALRNQNNHEYEASIDYWQEVLTKNNNFDLAYIGIGKALYNQGKYSEAQEMLSKAYEVDNYSKAFNELRKQFISKYLLPMAIAIVVVLMLVFKFLGYAKKKNKAVTLKVGKKTYWEELIFAFHLVFHPFDGFWDLKHEKRGSLRAALTFIGLTIAAFFYQAIGQGYTFNPRQDYSTIFFQVIAVLVPVVLWCVSNWCLTTLFDGEGSFKDIIVATGYSLAPLPLFVILSTVLTNVLTSAQGSMVSLLVSIGYIWVGILIFFGMLVTHDYTLNKNFITTLGTILAMAVIMFIIILFFSLVAKMIVFIIAIGSEVAGRL